MTPTLQDRRLEIYRPVLEDSYKKHDIYKVGSATDTIGLSGLEIEGDVADLKQDQTLTRKVTVRSQTIDADGGMTFLRLLPREYGSTLRYLKQLRSANEVSLALKPHDLKGALLARLQDPRESEFAKRREFIIEDIAELAHLYAHAHHASDLLFNLRGAFDPVQPFRAHDGLRFIYDVLPSDEGWAIFRMDGQRAKLSDHALLVDFSAANADPRTTDERAGNQITFLARLEDYKREQSEKEYAGASEISPQLMAKLMHITRMNFHQDSGEAKELAEFAEGEELDAEALEAKEAAEPPEAEEREEFESEEEPEETDEGEELAEATELEGAEAEEPEVAEASEIEEKEQAEETEAVEPEESSEESDEPEEAEAEESEAEEAAEPEEKEEGEEPESAESETGETEVMEGEEAEAPEAEERGEGEEAEVLEEAEAIEAPELEEKEEAEEPKESEVAEAAEEDEAIEAGEIEEVEAPENEEAEVEPAEIESAEETEEETEQEAAEAGEEPESGEDAEAAEGPEPEEASEVEESVEANEEESSEESEKESAEEPGEEAAEETEAPEHESEIEKNETAETETLEDVGVGEEEGASEPAETPEGEGKKDEHTEAVETPEPGEQPEVETKETETETKEAETPEAEQPDAEKSTSDDAEHGKTDEAINEPIDDPANDAEKSETADQPDTLTQDPDPGNDADVDPDAQIESKKEHETPEQQREREKHNFEIAAHQLDHGLHADASLSPENIDADFRLSASAETQAHMADGYAAVAQPYPQNIHLAAAATDGASPLHDLKNRLYSIATTATPALDAQRVEFGFDGMPFTSTYTSATDPAHDLADKILKDEKLQKFDTSTVMKVRYPNMNHSFGAMFMGIPSLNAEPEMD